MAYLEFMGLVYRKGWERMQKIAVYNNATGIAGRLEFLCRGEQIEIVVEKTKEKLMEDVVRRSVSMILLDVFMEEQGLGEGLRLIAEVRKTCRMPIIVVSDQTSETAKVAALSIGADDFTLCPPFTLNEA